MSEERFDRIESQIAQLSELMQLNMSTTQQNISGINQNINALREDVTDLHEGH
jgi:polyhydroxyalkanoate synthesis regulator phasin